MASVITSKVGTGTSVPLSINASNTYFKGNVIFNKSVTCNVTSTNSIFFDGTGNLYVDVGNIQFSAKDSFQLRKGYSSYSLPSKTGTIALTSDITSSIDDLKEALKPLMYSNSYDTFGKAPSGHDNYYELCVLKSASDTENGGSLLLEATLGDYGREKQGYILCQISTRDGL